MIRPVLTLSSQNDVVENLEVRDKGLFPANPAFRVVGVHVSSSPLHAWGLRLLGGGGSSWRGERPRP